MSTPSYATVLTSANHRPSHSKRSSIVSTAAIANGDKKPLSFEQQIEELSNPPPQTMTLAAALQLLCPLTTQSDVYLLTRSYLQNWLIWASHQKVTKMESTRVEAALQMAASKFGLLQPTTSMDYTAPGPIDVSILCVDDNPSLLKPDVIAIDGTTSAMQSWARTPDLVERVKSLPTDAFDQDANMDDTLDMQDDNTVCCAVPERFYEMLRSTHGVVCQDGFEISFQAHTGDSSSLLHFEASKSPLPSQTQTGLESIGIQPRSTQTNGYSNGHHSSPARSRPLEFKRRVLYSTAPSPMVGTTSAGSGPASPMAKLMHQERTRHEQQTPSFKVEVHPVRLECKVLGTDGTVRAAPQRCLALVSERSRVQQVLNELLRAAAVKTSTSCKRVWCKRVNGTSSGDGYELINQGNLDGKLQKKNGEDKPELLVGDWLRTFDDGADRREISVLIETRKTGGEWPRAPLELQNRLRPGDYVDAQDETGRWYESLVCDVSETSVKVHYMGWASKWDTWVKRNNEVDVPGNINSKLNPPAPLWTHTPRWRDALVEGSLVEVRDSSSVANRPRWYKGTVRQVQAPTAEPQIVTMGAELEKYDDNGALSDSPKAQPLLLLGRKTAVFVFIEEELRGREVPVAAAAPNPSDNASREKQHPSLRWINVYGEELCKAGTHVRIEPEKPRANVATLRYEYDAGRKPVEIMKSFNNMYGGGFMKESLRGNPPAPGSVGLHNLGNSCFLNSIVQCLNHIEQLTKFFLDGKYLTDLNQKNPLGSGGHVAIAYANLLNEIWAGKYSALAPRMLKQTVASFAPQFNNCYQHDSQEFCQFLMDGLHEDCNRVKSKPYVEELEGFGQEDSKVAIETWRKHLLRHDSIVVDHCQGMHRSHLTCPICGRESIKFDVFSTISLPISTEKNNMDIRLENCIEKFMEGEQLDEMNAWYCPSCKKHVCALKMIALWSVPDILILHLKRFTFEHDQVNDRVIRSKIDSSVKFPIDHLDMSKYVLGPKDPDAPPIYRLFGVSEHAGMTANSGHYTATVRNSKDSRWYRYNDAHVGETTGDATVTGGAYVLFYKRVKGEARWAGLEKAMASREIDPHGALETDQDGFKKVKTKARKKGR